MAAWAVVAVRSVPMPVPAIRAAPVVAASRIRLRGVIALPCGVEWGDEGCGCLAAGCVPAARRQGMTGSERG
ncbi:hypothetical protein GCM10023084_39700 [Streptomyces lacrimifluminis]|uniref:Uncharacterized protein n=1 Tax=Streptomyces lacrimifluminis TaxID=1500077 RepID=A0A917NY93_9ACTN|nr:hypothetical protein GCM10012282_41320 [Streptomyces lacrimifluminis]